MASYFIKLPKVSGGGGGGGAVDSVNGRTGNVVLSKSDVNLGNVDNTSDLNKPISTATQTALNAKANDNAVVKLTGTQSVAGAKTFSDDVTVSKTTGNAALIVNAALATDAKNLTFQTAGLNRWRFRVDGANDDLTVRRYDNAGAFVDAPVLIDRSTGVATINGSTMADKENVANKATSLTSPDNTTYPTTQAVADRFSAEDAAYFGGGTDGDVTITSSVTLVRDMFYNNLTISGAGTINAAGYRIFVAGTLTVSGVVSTGKIQRNGNAAANSSGQAGAAGASALGAASLGGSGGAQSGATGGAAGGAGGNAISNAGTVNCMGGDPGDSGDGGAGASAAGGVGAAPSLLTPANLFINNRFSDFFFRGTAMVSGGIGGQGGSGGGGGTGVGGGGGGGGGGAGIVWVSAKTIDLSSAVGPIISAVGGNAGNGHNIPSNGGGGGGGGAGGGGGYCFFAYKNAIGTLANFIDVSGGRGGNGGNGNSPALGGEGGGSGAGGAATIINLQTGVVTQLARGTSNPKVAASGSTGGTGATAPTHQLGI